MAEEDTVRLRRLACALALTASALVIAGPALAAAPDAYVAEMPSPDKVIAEIQGSDPFDTAARQYTVFSWLESMVLELMGDRYVAGGMTPAEKTLRDGYHDNYLRIQHELLASLPESDRVVAADTKYGQWQTLVNTYFVSADFYKQFLEKFFTPSFRGTYAPIHAAAIARDPWVGFSDPPPAVAPARDWTWVWVGFLVLGGLAGLGGARNYGRRRGD
jgi:hypothetical protein